MAPRLSKADKYARTRAALLDTAHEMFAERGYTGVSTQDIVKGAKVTRGALYYHFSDKRALFQAVFERFRHTRGQAVQARMQAAEGDLWQRTVKVGSAAFIDSLSDEQAQRIIFSDGPSVLDPDIWHKNVQGEALIRQVLGQLVAAGLIKEPPYDALTRLLWGALLEAGIYIAHATDRVKARREMLQGIEYLFNSLRTNRPSS